MPGTRLVTAEELLAKDAGRLELVRGEVVEMTPAGARHSRIGVWFAHRVLSFLEGKDLGEVYGADVGFHLERDPDTVRAPDMAFVAKGRLEGHDERRYLPLAPDLVLEVVSPTDTFAAVEKKARMWIGAGVRLVWVADPDLRRVFVYRPDGARGEHAEGEDLSGEDVLAGLSIRLEGCF